MSEFVVPQQGAQYADKSWEGRGPRKPWQYPVQLVIPHLGWVEPLKIALELWQRQTIRPYICIIDTGSEWNYMQELESLRAENVEIHYVRGHGYRHASEPVAVAMDVAAARCSQTYQFHTHSDVFPMRRDLIESFVAETSAECPVAGYQISDRSHVSGAMKLLWKGMVGHTATCIHFPTIRDLGITWSLDRGFSEFPGINRDNPSDTDTEIPFNMHLRSLGINPKLLGSDANWVRDTNNDFDHCRSFTSSALYSRNHFKKARGWIAEAMLDAAERVKEWDNEEAPATCDSVDPCGCSGADRH